MVEEDFIGKLYLELYETMFSMAFHKLHDEERIQEVIQETFLFAMYRREGLEHHPNPQGWLMNTLKFMISNERRRAVNTRVVCDESIYDYPAAVPEEPLEDSLPIGLTEGERNILIWRFERQLSHREMAALLSITEVNCRNRLSRALKKCRKLLGYP